MASRNGVDLHYERTGDGPRLLYCNGSGTTLDTVRPLLDVLGGSFELLAFDHRGMGRSTCAHEPYAMADLAADVASLLDEVGWDRCRVAGLSFGGMVAQEVAVTFPDRVERLALLCTSPGGGFPSYPLEELADLPEDERMQRSMLLADRRWTPEWLAAHPDQQGLVQAFADRRPSGETDDQRWGRIAQLACRSDHDVLDRLARVTAPTFVGAGAYDDIAPVANAEVIVERVPDAALHVYDGGHAFVVQDPTALPQVIEFLAAG